MLWLVLGSALSLATPLDVRVAGLAPTRAVHAVIRSGGNTQISNCNDAAKSRDTVVDGTWSCDTIDLTGKAADVMIMADGVLLDAGRARWKATDTALVALVLVNGLSISVTTDLKLPKARAGASPVSSQATIVARVRNYTASGAPVVSIAASGATRELGCRDDGRFPDKLMNDKEPTCSGPYLGLKADVTVASGSGERIAFGSVTWSGGAVRYLTLDMATKRASTEAFDLPFPGESMGVPPESTTPRGTPTPMPSSAVTSKGPTPVPAPVGDTTKGPTAVPTPISNKTTPPPVPTAKGPTPVPTPTGPTTASTAKGPIPVPTPTDLSVPARGASSESSLAQAEIDQAEPAQPSESSGPNGVGEPGSPGGGAPGAGGQASPPQGTPTPHPHGSGGTPPPPGGGPGASPVGGVSFGSLFLALAGMGTAVYSARLWSRRPRGISPNMRRLGEARARWPDPALPSHGSMVQGPDLVLTTASILERTPATTGVVLVLPKGARPPSIGAANVWIATDRDWTEVVECADALRRLGSASIMVLIVGKDTLSERGALVPAPYAQLVQALEGWAVAVMVESKGGAPLALSGTNPKKSGLSDG